MARAIRACVQRGCMARKEKKIYQENDVFCSCCGSRLGYVCRRCWRPLPDGSLRLCEACRLKSGDDREFLGRLGQAAGILGRNAMSVTKAAYEASRAAGETIADSLSDPALKEEISDRLSQAGRVMSEGLETVKQMSAEGRKLVREYAEQGTQGEEKDRQQTNADILRLPDYCEPVENPASADRAVYSLVNSETRGILMVFPAEPSQELSYDWLSALGQLREEMDGESGIIEVAGGTTLKKRAYVYHLTKHRLADEDGKTLRIQYKLTMQLKLKDQTMMLVGRFDEAGKSGQREKTAYQMLKNLGKIPEDFEPGRDWYKDPYLPDWKYGFLMNLSEEKTFDKHFPDHPLSAARELVLAVRDAN